MSAPVFPDCVFPDDCECAKRGYQLEMESCAVSRVRTAVADLGIDLDLEKAGLGKPKPCVALLIDPLNRTISETTYIGLEGLQTLVGGSIEAAYQWPNRDVLYVDEEGLFKDAQMFFAISVRPDQPLAGNGVLVGREVDDLGNTAPPQMTIERLSSLVRFLGRL
jgi:hypothetical protein